MGIIAVVVVVVVVKSDFTFHLTLVLEPDCDVLGIPVE